MIRTFVAVALAGAVALPVAAAPSAADDRDSATGLTRGDRFDQLDKNHDGFISRDEGKDAEELNTRFTELDTNNDNRLSREEYNALNNKSARGASGATGSKR